MRFFRRKPRTIPAFDQPKTYHLPTPGQLDLQPNIERACEVYWAAMQQGHFWVSSWDEVSDEMRDRTRVGVAAVLHWAQQQERG